MQGPAAPAPSAAFEAPLEAALKNVKEQGVGPGTLAEVGMPEPYLRRVAEHVMRASFEDNFRIVVDDAHAAQASPPASAPTPGAGQGGSAAWAVGVAVVLLGVATVLVLRRKS
ncbi:MAG: hypothetical protein RIR65_1698 [Planctomycetota bacterium]